MGARGWLALASLIVGIVTAAWGLTHGVWWLALAGIALVLVFWYFAFVWLTGASRPMGASGQIKPAANAAWNMKNQPAAQAGETEKKD